jgi:hypothetical protein
VKYFRYTITKLQTRGASIVIKHYYGCNDTCEGKAAVLLVAAKRTAVWWVYINNKFFSKLFLAPCEFWMTGSWITWNYCSAQTHHRNVNGLTIAVRMVNTHTHKPKLEHLESQFGANNTLQKRS